MPEGLLHEIERCAYMALRAACTGLHDQGLPRLLWNLARLEAYAEQTDLLDDGGIEAFYIEQLPSFDMQSQRMDMQEFQFCIAHQSWSEELRSKLALAPYAGAESRAELAFSYYGDVLRALESDWHRGHFSDIEAEELEEWSGHARRQFVTHFGEEVTDRLEARVTAEDYPPCNDAATLARITHRGRRTVVQLIALLSCPPD